MDELEKFQWEYMTLEQVLNILCDDTNDYDKIVIFGADKLSPAMKKVLGIKKED